MKKQSLIYHIIFATLILQPFVVSAVTIADLKEYYASFNRGAKCFFQGKKCSEKDQRAWRRGSGTILLAVLAIAGFTQRGRLATLFTKRTRKEDITEWPREISMDINNVIMEAISTADVNTLERLAKDPKNLNVVFAGKSLLREAIQYAMGDPDNARRITIIKILLENNGRKYDYDQSAQKDLTALNKMNWSSAPESQARLKVLQEINKLWDASRSSITHQSQSIGQMPKAHQLVEDGDVNKLTDLLDEGGFDENSVYLEESLLKRAVRKAFEFPLQERRIEIVENLLYQHAKKDRDTLKYIAMKNNDRATMNADQQKVLKKIKALFK